MNNMEIFTIRKETETPLNTLKHMAKILLNFHETCHAANIEWQSHLNDLHITHLIL